ncbi:MAG: hypothetical protein WC269_01290 [Candidatus Gracilibacteria bacterium]|jgi:hypothetical protein
MAINTGGIDSGVENWGSSWKDRFNREPDDKANREGKKDNPDLSILSPEEESDNKKSQEQSKEAQKKQREETKLYNVIAFRLGGGYSPDILRQAASKYFDGAAQKNPADIDDPKQRKIVEEQNRQVDKICKVLSDASDGGKKNDLLKNAFFEYVKDVELARNITAMEQKLSPYGRALTASENAEQQNRFAKLRQESYEEYQHQLEDGSLAKRGEITDNARKYNLSLAVVGAKRMNGSELSGSEMPREQMQIYYEKLKQEEQGNIDKANLAALDKQIKEGGNA